MDLVTGEGTQGLLSLFGGTARVSLHVRLGDDDAVARAGLLRRFGDLPDGDYDQTPTAPAGDPIVPISFDATFRISPAVDRGREAAPRCPDSFPTGALQPTTFARLSMCIEQSACDRAPSFDSRRGCRCSQLNAEVLVGDQLVE